MSRGPYRSSPPKGAAAVPRASGRALFARAVLAVLAVVAAAAAVALVGGNESDEGRTWTFMEDTADPATLDLRTGIPGSGLWRLEDDADATGSRALVNHAGAPGERPAVAIATGQAHRDVLVETRCRTGTTTVERACGVVFRHSSEGHHYVARVDVASSRVILAVVLAGSERILAAEPIPASTDRWHEIEVQARGDHLVVLYDDRPVLDVNDPTYPNPGGVGLWAPAACVAHFDHLTVEPLPSVAHPTELLPFLL